MSAASFDSTKAGGAGNTYIAINSGAASAETTDCDVSELRIYDFWMTNWGVSNINSQLMATSTVGRWTVCSFALDAACVVQLVPSDTIVHVSAVACAACAGDFCTCVLAAGSTGTLPTSCNVTPALFVTFPTSSTVVDSSPSANTVSVAVGLYTWQTEQAGFFASAINYITVAATTNIYLPVALTTTPRGTWTITLWFLAPFVSTGNWQTLSRGSAADHHVIVSSTGLLGAYSSGFYSCGYNISALTNPQWYHLAAVASGSSTAFYINAGAVGVSGVAVVTNIYYLFTCCAVTSSQAFQSAGVYALRVYGSALSQSCLQNMMYYDRGIFGTCWAISVLCLMKMSSLSSRILLRRLECAGSAAAHTL